MQEKHNYMPRLTWQRVEKLQVFHETIFLWRWFVLRNHLGITFTKQENQTLKMKDFEFKWWMDYLFSGRNSTKIHFRNERRHFTPIQIVLKHLYTWCDTSTWQWMAVWMGLSDPDSLLTPDTKLELSIFQVWVPFSMTHILDD